MSRTLNTALIVLGVVAGASMAASQEIRVDLEKITREIETSPAYEHAQKVVDNIEPELNRQVGEIIEEKKAAYDAIQRQIVHQAVGPAPAADEDLEGLFEEKSRIFIFLSRSVPLDVLKGYAADIQTLADDNIRLVFRALPRHFLDTFLRKGPECTHDDCVTQVKIAIGSRLFNRYGIHQVPAVVYDPDPSKPGDDWLAVSGAAPLNEILSLFYQRIRKGNVQNCGLSRCRQLSPSKSAESKGAAWCCWRYRCWWACPSRDT